MTILFLTRLFYPHLGGVEKHVLAISKELIKKGHKVSVITEDLSTKDIPVYLQSKKTPSIEEFQGVKIYRIPVGRDDFWKKFRIWFWLWSNRQLIGKADVVHAHDVFFWFFPFRFLYPQKKVFVTFHGYESFPISKKALIQRKIAEKLSLGNICVGDFIHKWYGTKPTFVTYGGVSVSNKRKEMSEKQGEKSAVFVGRLDEQTGILTYLEAVKKIREKIPDFKFIVLGDGKYKNRIPDDVVFKGFVRNPERELTKYNFVFASRYLSILEALKARRLVFAVYDNPLKKDYLLLSPFAKFIIVTNSAKEITSKTLYFLKNPKEKEKIVNTGFNWAKRQSWERLTNLYLNLWLKSSKDR